MRTDSEVRAVDEVGCADNTSSAEQAGLTVNWDETAPRADASAKEKYSQA